MSSRYLCFLKKVVRGNGNFIRNYSRKVGNNNESSYKPVKPKHRVEDSCNLVWRDPSFELLTANEFPLFLRGNIGLAWYDTQTTIKSHHELIMEQIDDSKGAFSKAEFDSICLSLSPDHWINPHRSLLGLGNYDINVIMKALQNRGYEAIWFDKRKDPSCLNLDNIIGFILNIPSDYKISFITIPLKRRHWIALKKLNGYFYKLDSKLDTPHKIGEETEFLDFLKEEINFLDKQLFLVVTDEVAKSQSWVKTC